MKLSQGDFMFVLKFMETWALILLGMLIGAMLGIAV